MNKRKRGPEEDRTLLEARVSLCLAKADRHRHALTNLLEAAEWRYSHEGHFSRPNLSLWNFMTLVTYVPLTLLRKLKEFGISTDLCQKLTKASIPPIKSPNVEKTTLSYVSSEVQPAVEKLTEADILSEVKPTAGRPQLYEKWTEYHLALKDNNENQSKLFFEEVFNHYYPVQDNQCENKTGNDDALDINNEKEANSNTDVNDFNVINEPRHKKAQGVRGEDTRWFAKAEVGSLKDAVAVMQTTLVDGLEKCDKRRRERANLKELKEEMKKKRENAGLNDKEMKEQEEHDEREISVAYNFTTCFSLNMPAGGGDFDLELLVSKDLGSLLEAAQKGPTSELVKIIGTPLFFAMMTSKCMMEEVSQGKFTSTNALRVTQEAEDLKVNMRLGFYQGYQIFGVLFPITDVNSAPCP